MPEKQYQKLDALVQKAMSGDKKAFARLCEQQAQWVIFLCIRLMGNQQDGEDAAQEAFIRMQANMPALRAPEAFITWAQRIAVSVCSKMRRVNMNQTDTLSLEEFADAFVESDEGMLPESYLKNAEDRRELMAVIDRLPERCRACIVLFYFRQLKISEIAQTLELSEGAVKSQLYLGREKIRRELEKRSDDSGVAVSALLPMAALGKAFQLEMEQQVTRPVIKRCLRGASIQTGVTLSPTAKSMLLAAACTAAVAASVAGFNHYSASSRGAAPMPTQEPQLVPQQGAPGFEDRDSATAESQAPQSARPSAPPPSAGRAGCRANHRKQRGGGVRPRIRRLFPCGGQLL